ncbi:MAG TPA: S46 family peptidase, partial [Terriglobales bacterium]
MKRRVLYAVAFLFVFCGLTWADEGMWLFNQPPKDRIKAKYGFELTEPWLHHVQTGSVRFNNGGSGSLVSADGLVFTNHHVGRVCLQQLSTSEKDYIKSGFSAKSEAEEGKCPDLELNVLMEIQDVTAKVQGAAKPGMSVAEQGQAIRAMQSQLESECAKATGMRCDVVTLYAGGLYHLYKYKKYTDVRVVFAPEAQMAFFGGDADNFEFPRYDLDITFFRIYENDKPVHLDNFLQFSHSGMKDGDLIFVSGHPGNTERLLTMAQLNFLRDVQTPLMLDRLTNIDNALKKFAAGNAENARVAADLTFGVENSLKAYKGRNHGLHDAQLMGSKQAAEDKLRKAVDANPKLKAEYGDVWEKIAAAVQKQRELVIPYTMFERNAAFMGELPAYAKTLVRVTAEKQKPSNERLREYSEARLPSLEQGLFSTAPVYKSLDEVTMANSLHFMLKQLGPENPMVKRILNGQTPEQVAHNAITNTK